MSELSKHFDALLAVDSSTVTLLMLFCGGTVILIRNHLASLATLLMLFPLAMGVSLVGNYALSLLGMFNPIKLGDWLVATILAGTFGTMFAIATAAVCARMWENSTAR